MEISKETREKIAANLEEQHRLIMESRALLAPLGAMASVGDHPIAVAWEYAYGDSASVNNPGETYWFSRDMVAKALRENKKKM